MKAIAIELQAQDLPPALRPFVPQKQPFLTLGRQYVIYAVSIYQSAPFVLIIDDSDLPVFKSASLFQLVTRGIPRDWICNINLGSGVDLVLGPEFLARDLDSYNRMIDQDAAQISRFWSHARVARFEAD